jgi:hypothetical protein
VGDSRRNVSCWNASESGLVLPLTQSTFCWQTSVENSVFNQLLLDTKIARNAKAAAPHVPYHPYFCPKRAERSPTWHDDGGDYVYGDSVSPTLEFSAEKDRLEAVAY